MKEYEQRMTGILNRDFQGHIRYMIQLPECVSKVRVQLTFDKREPEWDPEQLRSECKDALLTNMPEEIITEELLDRFVKFPKGEINMSIAYHHAVLGTAHRNELVKEVWIGAEDASEGFLPTRFQGGLLEITLHCLNIVNDGTNYELIVEGSAQ